MESDITTLSGDASNLNDPIAGITARLVTSSNSSIVTGTASPNTAVGSHIVVVNNLATTSAYYSNDEQASGSSTISQGSFTITVGTGSTATPTTITVDSSNDTLDGLASTINSQVSGVTASVITDTNGARLAIVSNSSGQAGNITISGNSDPINWAPPIAGTNASITVDGVPISSSSNTVTGAVNGLTLNLVGADPGAEVGVGVTPDINSIANTINSFVTDYNSLVSDINTQFTYSTTTNSSGPLAGDSLVRMLQSDLMNATNYSDGGTSAVQTLQDMGISMNDDGTLTVDASDLANALNSNFSAVQQFFQGLGTNSGFASQVITQLDQFTDPVDGAFTVDLSGLNSTVSSLQDQINNFQTYLATEQQQWTSYYDTISVQLQELPSQENMTNAILGLNTSSSSSSSSQTS
jgi:flagellar hook-associated protein 2